MLPGTWTTLAKLSLITAVIVVVSESTDADLLDRETVPMNSLRASTLDLSTKDTANHTQKSLFFSVQGLLPGGFQVNSVRIENEGELNVEYTITTELTNGADHLCPELQLRVLEDWHQRYHEQLQGFAYSSSLPAGDAEDLVFAVQLANSTTSLIQSNCTFNFIVTTTQEAGGGAIRFRDEETLQNHVATGSWSNS